ncbi:hypothetical protein ACHAWU_001398 [Discostella pseudostelligera]|uniref:Uncharacterized protein n=1 Tax=Discostella pseudostelligera TaxID=259834 RepID=A0ABD3M5I0_9STRA
MNRAIPFAQTAASRSFYCRCRPSPTNTSASCTGATVSVSVTATATTLYDVHYNSNYTIIPRSISTTPTLQLALPAANKKKSASSETTPKASPKKVNKEKKGPSASKLEKQVSQESRMEALLIKAYDAPALLPPSPSVEEANRRYEVGRNYVIGSFERHNEMYHDLAVKIRMKRYALQLLPREKYDLGDATIPETAAAAAAATTTTTTSGAAAAAAGGSSAAAATAAADGSQKSVYAQWKSAAYKLNPNWGPPDHRHVPMYTPPIEGFDINMYADQEDEDK